MTTVRRTRRWRGIVAVALAAAAVGVVAGRPSIIFLTVVGVAFAAYPELATTPEVALDLERTLDEDASEHDVDVETEAGVGRLVAGCFVVEPFAGISVELLVEPEPAAVVSKVVIDTGERRRNGGRPEFGCDPHYSSVSP